MEIITVKEAAALCREYGFKVGWRSIEDQIRTNFPHLGEFRFQAGSGKWKLAGIRKNAWKNYLNIRQIYRRRLFSATEI